MPRDDWFRSSEWNDAIAAEFEKRLGRARAFNRCQYIRIQGYSLLEQTDDRLRAAGATLMQRVLSEFPDQKHDAGSAHVALGDYFAALGQYEKALEHFRIAAELEEQNVYTNAYLRFAEVALDGNLEERYPEALELLCEGQAQHNKLTPFRSEVFRFYVCNARLASRQGLPKDAAHFASRALAMAEVTKPMFPKHPTVGVIQLESPLRDELQRLAHTVN